MTVYSSFQTKPHPSFSCSVSRVRQQAMTEANLLTPKFCFHDTKEDLYGDEVYFTFLFYWHFKNILDFTGIVLSSLPKLSVITLLAAEEKLCRFCTDLRTNLQTKKTI